MTDISYDEVVKLADQLTTQEQVALFRHLQTVVKTQNLTSQEKKEAFESIIVNIPPGEDFSFSREDWYGDDGR